MEEKCYTVLLVEDSEIVLLKTAQFLTKNGFNVIKAKDGEKAIEIYKEKVNEIDVIVSDLLMPNVDGYEFALYNYNNNHLPFVAYTSVNDAVSAITLHDRGVYFYVQKPYVPNEFIVYITQAIQRWEFNKGTIGYHGTHTGNLGSITIDSSHEGLMEAMSWFTEKNKDKFAADVETKLIHNFNEILLNAYEHGNLGITEEEKTHLIQQGGFQKKLEELEKECTKRIVVSQSTLKDHIAISIKDEGKGFNYRKYLEMTSEELLERINMPNGRGIYISTKFFDRVEYTDNGSKVILVKSFCTSKSLSVSH